VGVSVSVSGSGSGSVSGSVSVSVGVSGSGSGGWGCAPGGGVPKPQLEGGRLGFVVGLISTSLYGMGEKEREGIATNDCH